MGRIFRVREGMEFLRASRVLQHLQPGRQLANPSSGNAAQTQSFSNGMPISGFGRIDVGSTALDRQPRSGQIVAREVQILNMTRRILLLSSLAAAASAANDPKSEKEVMEAMETWRQAFLKKDEPTLRRILHENLVYTHSNGRFENKAQFLEAFLKGQNYAQFELSDTVVHVQGNTAVVRSTVDIRGANSAGTPFLVAVLHVWTKTGPNWQLLARQATRLNPPGGGKK